MHGEYGNRAGAFVPTLPQQREGEPEIVCPGALHGAVEPLEESPSPYSNSPIGPITARTVPLFGLDRPFS
jgi:hypothetical protein